jgi:hypothetical protein
MKIAEIEKEALSLSEQERGHLAAALLETLPLPVIEVTDEEVWRREADMDSGRVQPITHEEFVRGIERERCR